ncbi:MAG: hypothetical protein BRD45_06025 [Bacteroidetes bacterium QS_8_64_10]|nr:MAG: hypothetical protein BRD45_06025 [Bacteroidetes bacterium QS_8_64_10]
MNNSAAASSARAAAAFLLVALLVAGCDVLTGGESAPEPGPTTYEVVFESTWSAETHPDDFPSDAHWSGLIGATHDAGTSIWQPGALASEGIANMAETGAKEPLRSEIEALIEEGQADSVLSGGGIERSPGSVSLTFEITASFPRVSLVSMIAPSPDWFAGVRGVRLLEDDGWTDRREETLYVYDAGSDSGKHYTAPNQATTPPTPISQIEHHPFAVEGEVRPVGTLIFTRQ